MGSKRGEIDGQRTLANSAKVSLFPCRYSLVLMARLVYFYQTRSNVSEKNHHLLKLTMAGKIQFQPPSHDNCQKITVTLMCPVCQVQFMSE